MVLRKLTPAQILVAGFAATILIGAVMLMLPISTQDYYGLTFIDALFTSTSAVCVTGLVVVDTGTTFSYFGYLVIMLLIQIGGLGFMASGSIFAIFLGKRLFLKERLILKEALNCKSVQGVVLMVKRLAFLTIFVEALGALLLTYRFHQEMPLAKSLFYGLFHAVSAFNNAGFDLMGGFKSMTAYVTDPLISLTIAFLIIIGGLGFAVSLECCHVKHFKFLSIHSKIVVLTTTLLLLIGSFLTFALESNNPQTLGNLDLKAKVLAAFFQSATARTAGFNTIDTAQLGQATVFIIIMLMFIGASPGSTGGGIKTSTFTTLILYIKNSIAGKKDVNIFERHISDETIVKSITIFFVSFLIVVTSTFLLVVTQDTDFLPTLFEATSAFGTVGLSMGVTSELDFPGKLIIIATMFCGRLGPLTIAMALVHKNRPMIKYPDDHVLVG